MSEDLNPRHAVYVGSFDPLTLGHKHIIRRGAAIFERITVGIGINPDKSALFTSDERLTFTREALSSFENVEVECFHGLAVDFVRQCGAAIMLRGVRTLSDMELEFTMSLANRNLEPRIETVFLMASEKYTHVSSSLIKQIASLGHQDTEVHLRKFVPAEVIQPLMNKLDRSESR